MPTTPNKPLVSVDGQLADWIEAERIDYGDVSGYKLYAQAQGESYYFALAAPIVVGANTTFWFNTDRNAATGYRIFGWAGGAEYNVNIKNDGTAALYSGGAGQTLVLDNIPIAYSADRTAIEFAIPKTAIGTPGTIDTLYDVNDAVFAPSDYSARPYVAYNDDIARTDPAHKVAIVYSATTAARYFSQTAYSQLFMAAQSQAMQAGIGFDVLDEGDLTDVAKLANYDAIVFPSFSNVQASRVGAITDALLRVTKQFGVGLITAGNFMTNDETGAALAGDSYARMKLLFDATRVTGGFPADVTVTSSDAGRTVFKTMNAGTVISNYKGVGWDTFQSVSGTGQTVATQTVGGQTYAAALATQTGGKNVLFSTPGVMADNNLLWQAIDHAADISGVSLDLEMSRFKGIVASRTDMDQAMYTADVSPGAGRQGIYDKMLPILAQWKQQYDFVGSYYVDIGNNAAAGETTNWAVSAPYYARMLALGNEIGTHSLTHPENTNVLTPAQIQTEFQQSKSIIEQQMSAYLGSPFTVLGAAVPGATETLPTSRNIIQYFDYITGGYSGIGAGYPGAFGYLTPDLTGSVYLAPNTSFDFTLADYQKLGAAGASAAWAAEWNKLTANADLPIVLWPWHDYGPTLWQTDPPNASPYSLQMFTDWIQRAYQSGAEFVTGADLAGRIKSFDASAVTSSVSGDVISATVTSPHAGTFALGVGDTGGRVIKNVAGWYAYDGNRVFLPETGGGYTITLGTSQDDVTHISALPMRGNLLSVTGDGRDIAFSMAGEGNVTISLGAVGGLSPVVTGSGAAIAGQSGDQLVVRLTGLGQHDVSVRMLPPTPQAAAAPVSTVAFSADTGASATDLVTGTAARTIAGTPSEPLATGDTVQIVSNDRTAPAAPVPTGGGATPSNLFTLSGRGEAGDTVAILDGTTGVGTATVGADGSWSWQFLAGPTARTFTAVQTDEAGNVGAASALMVTGTGGVDALSGGTGNDLFVGGAGADTFSFAGAFGQDIVADFAATGAAHDVIGFEAGSSLNSFAAVMDRTTQIGTGVVIGQDSFNAVTLLDVTKNNLSADNFRFV